MKTKTEKKLTHLSSCSFNDTPTKRPSSKGPAVKGPATKGPGYEMSGSKRSGRKGPDAKGPDSFFLKKTTVKYTRSIADCNIFGFK